MSRTSDAPTTRLPRPPSPPRSPAGAPGAPGPGARPRRPGAPTRPSAGPVRRGPRWPWLAVTGTVLVAVVLIAVAVLGSGAPESPGRSGDPAEQPAPAAVATGVSSVPAAVLSSLRPSAGVAPEPVVGGAVPVLHGPGGRPEVLYVGAEYCPYCAAERWALTVALAQFGTFSGLKVVHSSPNDPAGPDTPTLSFAGAHYTSRWVDFVPVELYTTDADGGTIHPLMRLTPAQQALVGRYDAAPYTTQPGAIPFIDVANRYIGVGAGYSPLALAHLTPTAIAGQLAGGRTPVARVIDGTAEGLVQRICSVTGDAAPACSG